MAYDEALAARIRDHFEHNPDIVEKKMFGGVAYMFQGNMAIGTYENGLMVRLDKSEHESALQQPGITPMTMGGKRMAGWIVVDAETITEDDVFASWVERGVSYAGSLPPK